MHKTGCYYLNNPSTLSWRVLVSFSSRYILSTSLYQSSSVEMSLEIQILIKVFPIEVTMSSFTSLQTFWVFAHFHNIFAYVPIPEMHLIHSGELRPSLSSHLCIWSLCVDIAVSTTALCVYTLLAVNGCVFTLDLIVSPPGLLLSTMFRTCLSAAVGCFKGGDTFVAELVSTWVFVFWRLGKEERNSLSGQCGPTQMWHSSVGYLVFV